MQDHGGETIIPFSCALERNLADMPEDEAAKYCEENKVQRLVQTGYISQQCKISIFLSNKKHITG